MNIEQLNEALNIEFKPIVLTPRHGTIITYAVDCDSCIIEVDRIIKAYKDGESMVMIEWLGNQEDFDKLDINQSEEVLGRNKQIVIHVLDIWQIQGSACLRVAHYLPEEDTQDMGLIEG